MNTQFIILCLAISFSAARQHFHTKGKPGDSIMSRWKKIAEERLALIGHINSKIDENERNIQQLSGQPHQELEVRSHQERGVKLRKKLAYNFEELANIEARIAEL